MGTVQVTNQSNCRPTHVNAFRLATTGEIKELLRKPQIKSCEIYPMPTCILRKCEDIPIMTKMSLSLLLFQLILK